MTPRVINSADLQLEIETLGMLAVPRFVLSEFLVFVYKKLLTWKTRTSQNCS